MITSKKHCLKREISRRLSNFYSFQNYSRPLLRMAKCSRLEFPTDMTVIETLIRTFLYYLSLRRRSRQYSNCAKSCRKTYQKNLILCAKLMIKEIIMKLYTCSSLSVRKQISSWRSWSDFQNVYIRRWFYCKVNNCAKNNWQWVCIGKVFLQTPSFLQNHPNVAKFLRKTDNVTGRSLSEIPASVG